MHSVDELFLQSWRHLPGSRMKAMACCSSRRFLNFFLWFWKPAPEKKKPIMMLVLSSVGFLFPCPPPCLCSQRKKEMLWFLLLAVADDDDSVEGLSHPHCHCLLSSVLFFLSPLPQFSSLFFQFFPPGFFVFSSVSLRRNRRTKVCSGFSRFLFPVFPQFLSVYSFLVRLCHFCSLPFVAFFSLSVLWFLLWFFSSFFSGLSLVFSCLGLASPLSTGFFPSGIFSLWVFPPLLRAWTISGFYSQRKKSFLQAINCVNCRCNGGSGGGRPFQSGRRWIVAGKGAFLVFLCFDPWYFEYFQTSPWVNFNWTPASQRHLHIGP